MNQRIYLDTSVFGGYFDEEFATFTIPLFKRINHGEFILLYSTITQDELTNAPQKVQHLVKNIESNNTEYIILDEEAIKLANAYIAEEVVGQTSFADCLHIALATIHKADYLISWNFRHIVNVSRIKGYNSVNIRQGYKSLEIRSPREFINYGDESKEI